ncbi:MAG: hypothetical protein Q8O03_02760 [Nanoarchaeota archaeon]|nr:hypothetical protein [Nanoarchaeota archaeon]
MERPPLEKLIERLEKLDIQEWKYEYYTYGHQLVARTNGLIIPLYHKGDYQIKIMSDQRHKEISYQPANKTEKDMLKKFCEKIAKSYEELREKELQERIDSFLSE